MQTTNPGDLLSHPSMQSQAKPVFCRINCSASRTLMQQWTPGIFLLFRIEMPTANNSPIASVALFVNELSNLTQHLR